MHYQSWRTETLRGMQDPVWTQWTITSPKKTENPINQYSGMYGSSLWMR